MIDFTVLKSFYFSRFRVNLKAGEDIRLPYYKGFALRGALGYALKKTVCIRPNTECSRCLVRFHCPYSLVMGNPLREDHPLNKKYNSPQRPYIIIPPAEGNYPFPAGTAFSFDFILIGKMAAYFPHFLYAFSEMGKAGLGRQRGRFSLVSVKALTINSEVVPVYDHNTQALSLQDVAIPFTRLDSFNLTGNSITIQFLTPLRIKVKQKLSVRVPFTLLLERLLERVVFLNHFFCNGSLVEEPMSMLSGVPDPGSVETVEEKFTWVDLERFSGRQQQRLKMGGLTGSVTYQGDFSVFLPLLRLGEHINVGKGTSSGFGRYILEGAAGF